MLARNPKCEDALANLVAMFLERKDSESVRRYSAMLAELQPDSPVAIEALATLAFADGDYLNAARHCRSLVDLVPDRFENWFNLGVAFHKLGNFEKAAQAYKQATALRPDSIQALLNLGVAYQELADLTSARLCYEKALELNPSQPDLMWNLALVLEQQGERNRAETLYAGMPERRRSGATLPSAWVTCGCYGHEWGPSAEAFQACLLQRPEWPEAHLNAGIAYARSGRPEDARRCFQDVLLMRPDSSDAVRGLAALALEAQDYEEAYQLHQRLIELGENSPELYYNAGLICQKRGAPNDAVLFYQQAINEDPQFAEALLNLGRLVLMAMGQEEEARSYWRKAIREKPELAQMYFEPSAA